MPDLQRVARFAAVELAIWGFVYGTYLTLRGAMIGQPAEAYEHADVIVGVERTLGLFHEARIQDVFDGLAGFFSAYYLVGFGPLIGLTAVWLFLRRPQHYRELRTVLLISIAIASVVFALFPVAPPRLVAGLEIADTVGLSDHDTGSFAGIRFNPYAAMPSMHVGWSVLLGWYGLRAARLRVVRTFFLLHPAVMILAVTATGNHYLLDSMAGAAVAGLAFALVRLVARLSVHRQLATISGGPTVRRSSLMGVQSDG